MLPTVKEISNILEWELLEAFSTIRQEFGDSYAESEDIRAYRNHLKGMAKVIRKTLKQKQNMKWKDTNNLSYEDK